MDSANTTQNRQGVNQAALKVIGVNIKDYERTINEWLNDLQTADSEDEDLDINNDIDGGFPLHTFIPRTVTDQIADNTGLTTAEVALVQQQEQDDDAHIRDMVTSTEYYDFTWSQDRQNFKGRREVFTGTPGPTFPITDQTLITDVFYQMFDADFLDMMVKETNRYAEQTISAKRNNPAKPIGRSLRWTSTNRDEMVTFLAILILQGLYPKVKEEAYFSFDGFGTTPYFSRIMSYNRYHLLKTFHHFIDNETTTDMTKLNKIRPVIQYLNDKFSSLYNPAQDITIDESLWHGRLSFAQKITTKAAQVGVKTYELCDSSSGYLWKFLVYTGKDGPNRLNRLDRLDGPNGLETRPTNVTSQIVYELIEPLLHKGHTLIMDNFYNSPLLARCLKRDGKTDVYGTLRLTREFVPETIKTLSKADVRQGEVVVSYCSDLAVMLWRDSNFVSMISTYHPLQVGTREVHNRLTYKPVIVLDYNKSMEGVDRKDQYLASQPLERHRNKIWYKKLFRRIFNAALFNCFVIYTSNQTHKIRHRQFRMKLAENLLKIHRHIDLTLEPRLLNKRPRTLTKTTSTTTTATKTMTTTTATPIETTSTTTSSISLFTIERHVRPNIERNHFPAASSSRYTRCWLCTRNKKPTRTAYKCEECNVNLCILGCFKQYHKSTM